MPTTVRITIEPGLRLDRHTDHRILASGADTSPTALLTPGPRGSAGEIALPPRWRILIVAGDQDAHSATAAALKDEVILDRHLEFLHARSVEEAKALLREVGNIAVALVDAFMDCDDAALDLVQFMREEIDLSDTRIILRTGRAGHFPDGDVMQAYDINDYRTTAELSRGNLRTAITVAVRSYSQLRTINANRRGLTAIVRASADLMTMLDVRELAARVIEQIMFLLELRGAALLCIRSDAPGAAFEVVVGLGPFACHVEGAPLNAIGNRRVRDALEEAAKDGRHQFFDDYLVLFVGARHGRAMMIFLEAPHELESHQYQLTEVFCTNVAVCLRNVDLVRHLHHQAYYDPVSQLPNRAHFVEKLHEAYLSERAPRLTLALIDVNHFSEINDAYGQIYGDKLLRAIAARLQVAAGPSILLARIEGDIFGVLGDDTIVTPGFLDSVFRLGFTIEDHKHDVSATFGLARLTEVDSASYAMQDVGIALKRAQTEQFGRHCYYTRNMGGEARSRVTLMQQLRRALGAGGLFLLYQPQIQLGDGLPVGAETLLRWRTEEGLLVPPEQFIPMAEDSGLIVAIGDWVLRGACEQLVALNSDGYTCFRMAINVSVVQFRHPDFLQKLEQILRDTGVDPTMIELEITESVAMVDSSRIVALLTRIKHLGVTVAIDDFGTGFSSLAYLQRLPVDRLKIDRGFVSRITVGGEGKNIAEMIIDLGRNLGMDVLAEGVEDSAQADYLRARGCHEAQGFLYARPLDATNLRAWLRAGPPRFDS